MLAIFTNCGQSFYFLLLMQTFEFLVLHLESRVGDLSHDCGSTTQGVGLRLRLGLFLFSNGLKLIQIASENGSVRYIFR
jgi:hypothetical protein